MCVNIHSRIIYAMGHQDKAFFFYYYYLLFLSKSIAIIFTIITIFNITIICILRTDFYDYYLPYFTILAVFLF